MQPRTPEQLEEAFEDAFMTRDVERLMDLFEDSAAFLPPASDAPVKGRDAIGRFVADFWEEDPAYAAEITQVIEAGDIAVVLFDWSLSSPGIEGVTTGSGVDVIRRDTAGSWRYCIGLSDPIPSQRRTPTGLASLSPHRNS